MKTVLGSCWRDLMSIREAADAYEDQLRIHRRHLVPSSPRDRHVQARLERGLRWARERQTQARKDLDEAHAILKALGYVPAPKLPKPIKSPHMQAWWDRKVLDDRRLRSIKTHEPRRHRVPPEWRELTDQALVLWYLIGLVDLVGLESVHAFTLNLNDDIEEQARAKPNAMKWFRARIGLELSKKLGRKVEWD